MRILITHEHMDHLAGLGGLLYTLDVTHPQLSLEIYGSEASVAKIRTLVQFAELKRGLNVATFPIGDGLVCEFGDIRCSAFKTVHSQGSYGFSFQENDQRHFISSAADNLGVPKSEYRQRLLAGESITLSNGTHVEPDMVLTPPQKGTKLVYTGDASFAPDLYEHSDRADCLISEATYLQPDENLAECYGHMTAGQAATVAKRSDVTSLYLTHISSRYDEAAVLREARRVFNQTFMARDMARIIVEKPPLRTRG